VLLEGLFFVAVIRFSRAAANERLRLFVGPEGCDQLAVLIAENIESVLVSLQDDCCHRLLLLTVPPKKIHSMYTFGVGMAMRIESGNVAVNKRRIESVGREKLYPEEKWDFMNLRLAPGTLRRLKQLLRRGETQTELVRGLVERELQRREAMGEPQKKKPTRK
jgi:hypothetical protein